MCAFQQQKPTRAETRTGLLDSRQDRQDSTLPPLTHLKGGLNELLPDANLLPKKRKKEEKIFLFQMGKIERDTRSIAPVKLNSRKRNF
jgi:hypothetical protein